MATTERRLLYDGVRGIAETLGLAIKSSGGCLSCGIDQRAFLQTLKDAGIDKANVVAIANELVYREMGSRPEEAPIHLDSFGKWIESEECDIYGMHLFIASAMALYGLDATAFRESSDLKS